MAREASETRAASAEVPDSHGPDSGAGIGSRIAPAVALLMMSGSVYADEATDSADGDDGDFTPVPEPSVLALLAAGAAVGGVAKYLHGKRRKK